MSTRNSIASVELKAKNGLISSCHIYTECFDDDNDVFIEVWNQGNVKNTEETIVIRHDVWAKIVEQLRERDG